MSEILYDFGSGRADPYTFPTEALKKAAEKAIDKLADELADYPGGLGHLGMRQSMARRESEREGVPVDPGHIVLTNGSMQAVTLTAQALQDAPGDTVILEEYSYPGILAAYRGLKLDMQGIPLDENGMRLDALEDRLETLEQEGRRPKFIYAISTYQNPSGFVMPKANRLALIELAARFEVPVVEDNCYADVHYEGPVEPALYALSDDPNQIYLCSLSKILGPGVRLGYLLARPPMLERIVASRHDAGSNTLAAAIVAEFYENGIWGHAQFTNTALKAKRDLTLQKLGEELDDIEATIDHVKKSNPDIFFTTVAYPIMNTTYYHKVADRVVLNKDWNEATDRDYVLRGRHSRMYYKYADQWLRNEVAAFRLQTEDPAAAAQKRLAAQEARSGMLAVAADVEA